MKAEEKIMNFWEHLEELRWTIIKILGTLIIFAISCASFSDYLLDFCIRPVENLIDTGRVTLNQAGPFDGVFIKMKTGLLFGGLLSFPFTILFLWNFIAPGLKDKEKKSFWWIFLSLCGLFILGASAGYGALFFILPVLLSLGVSGAENIWSLNDYLSFLLYWELSSGLLMELPLLMLVLVRLGIIEVGTIKKGRAYAFLAAFIVSAVITSDPFSLLILGFLLYILFEAGIFISSLQKEPKKE